MNFEEDLTLFVRHTYTIWHKTRTGNDLVGQDFKITYSVSISAVTPELELDQNPDVTAITQWIWKQFQTVPPNPNLFKGLPPTLDVS